MHESINDFRKIIETMSNATLLLSLDESIKSTNRLFDS
jgi:hypothetical protein